MNFKKSVLSAAIISTQVLMVQPILAEDEFSIDDYFGDYDEYYKDDPLDEKIESKDDNGKDTQINSEINSQISAEITSQESAGETLDEDNALITEEPVEKLEDIKYAQATDKELQESEELEVTGYFIPDEKKETSQIANVLNFDDMAKTGDSNAGDALKRVSGLSLVGGKFIYVRGLDDRYSSALLNGAVLPSPEPNKKVAPMDIFPTNVLESVLVQKTYSPEFPGEFAGGIIQMRSKALPDLPFTKLSLGTGFLTGSTFGMQSCRKESWQPLLVH